MQHRYLCSEMVSAWFTGPQGSCGETAGILEEVWETGACLQLEEPLELGSQVRFKPLERAYVQELEGIVRSSRYEEELGFLMEIEFTNGYRWNAQLYRPRHLLDPQTVKAAAPKAKTRAATAGAGSQTLPARFGVSRSECNRP